MQHAFDIHGGDLARLLATCPDDTLRDGKRAFDVHGAELIGGKDAPMLDALAAILAETRTFDNAGELRRKARAHAAFDKEFGAKARERLKFYEQR